MDENLLEEDKIFEFEGITVLMDKTLHSELGGLLIDFVDGKGIEVSKSD